MNWNRSFARSARTLLSLALLLSAAGTVHAQNATGFLGIAGTVQNSQGVGQNNVVISVRNAATNRTEVTTTPSTAGASAGFYFVALSDFSGNRAAQVADTLNFSATQNGQAVGLSPSTTVVAAADVQSSLLKLTLTIGGAAVNKTPPTPVLSYTPSSGVVAPNNQIAITANFTENGHAANVGGTIVFTITGNGGTFPLNATQATTASAWTANFTTAAAGVYTVAVTGASDTSGNQNSAATNASFTVAASAPTAPAVSVGSATAALGGADGAVNVSLANVPNQQVGGLQFTLSFDATKVSFDTITTPAGATSAGFSAGANVNPTGVLNVVVFGTQDLALGSGPVATINFTALAGATVGTVVPLTAGGLHVPDRTGNDIAGSTITNGSVKIGGQTQCGCRYLSNATSISIGDAIKIVRVALKIDPFTSKFDYHCNGTCTIGDAIKEVRFALRIDSLPPTCQ